MRWKAWTHWMRRWPDGDFAAATESLAQDVRVGVRAMGRSPGFSVIAVASLAIGIGANVTMFAAIDALLVRTPPHVQHAERIHRVYFEFPSADGTRSLSSNQGYRTYATIRDNVSGLEAVAALSAATISTGRGAGARPVDAVLATPSYFTMLGVRPALGRFFTPDEELDEREHVAVLGYDAWQAQFGGDSSILGRTIDVAGAQHTIVGVAPDGFTGADVDRVDLWLPIGVENRLRGRPVVTPTGGSYWLEILAKRRDSVLVEDVEREVTRVYRDRWRDEPQFDTRFGQSRAVLGPLLASRGPDRGADAKVSVWVAAVSLLVLLIACANVANLLLLRGLTRAREVAVRLSLGATRWRLVRQGLVEGALLAAAAAVCALLLARWTAAGMRAFLLPRADTNTVFEPRLLVFTASIALGTAILASVVPALVSARRDFGPLLGSRTAGTLNRLVLQRTLIGAQVAVAMLLLVGAGLFVTSLKNVRAIDLGLDVDRLLYVRLDARAQGKLTRDSASAAANAMYAAMLERVRRVPGVASATLTAGEPLTSGWGVSFRRRGAPPIEAGTPVPFGRGVGTDYFQTMGTALRRGRLFTVADHVPGARVAIVDETTAKSYWPDGNALDPCVYMGSDSTCTEIVGVVANTVLWQITGDRGPIVYFPLEASLERTVSMMEVRTVGDPTSAIGAVRQAILTVSSDLPWVDVRPVSERLAPQLRPWRLGASMFTAFGVLALCLAAIGLYGLISYVVAQRTHEIGVRKALGASDRGVARLILGGAMAMTTVGVLIGLVSALGAGRLVASQLYGISPHDPVVLMASAGGLLVVAIVACLVPARRATRVDPMVALRTE